MTSTTHPTGGEPVAGPTSPARGRRCKTRRTLDNIHTADPAKASRIVHLLNLDPFDPDEPGWTDRALAKALELDGHRISAAMLSIHRTATCICTDHDDEDTP